MSHNTKISFFTWAKWIRDKYVNLEKQTIPHAFKYLSTREVDNKQIILIGFSGQTHTIELPLKQIIKNNLFEYFSSADKKLLFSLLHKNEKYLLSEVYKCQMSDKYLVVLTEIKSGHNMTLYAQEVSQNSELVERLSPKNINIISFLAGTDSQKIKV